MAGIEERRQGVPVDRVRCGGVAATFSVLGLMLAAGGVSALKGLADQSIPRVAEIGFDRTMLAVTVAVSLTSVLLFGTLPAVPSTVRRRSDMGAP